MTDSSLIVPIDISALAIGSGDQAHVSVLPCHADFSQLPWRDQNGAMHNPGPFLAACALAGSTPFDNSAPYPVGVHLHWALPFGLTAGTQPADPTQPMHFPTVPNRWLVTRLVTRKAAPSAAPLSVRSWVVESDRLSAAPPVAGFPLLYPTVPVGPSNQTQTFAYIGQSFDLAGWTETAADRLSPLTAIGYGETTFAAYYPNCCTSFGFHDTLADVAGYDAGSDCVSYMVAGWYAAAADDPLGGSAPAAAAALGWTVPDGATPTRTVLYGMVQAIAWNPAGTNVSGGPNPLDVAVGASPQEAFAALLAGPAAQTDPNLANAELALNALQFGLLPATEKVTDVLATLEESIHAAGFSSRPGGSAWIVQPATVTAGAPAQTVALSAALGKQLDQLNQDQQTYDGLCADIQAGQATLFLYWNAFQVVNHQTTPPAKGAPTANDLTTLLTNAASAVAALSQKATTLAAQIQTEAAALKTALASQGLLLSPSAGAPRYWQPNDPVLALSGADVTPVTRFTASPTVACRVDGELVTGITLSAGAVAGSSAVTLAGGAIPWIPAVPASQMPTGVAATVTALLQETAFLAAPLQGAVVAAIAGLGGDGNPASKDAAGTFAAYGTAATAFLAGAATGPVSFGASAVPPDATALAVWSGAPWLPIMMHYRVDFTAASPLAGLGTYPAKLLSSGGFALDPQGVDYQFSGTVAGQAAKYVGSALLSPKANSSLSAAIAAFMSQSGVADPDLPALKAQVDGLPQLSQGLFGLTQAMLMREPTLQMPVFDPSMSPVETGVVLKTFFANVGTQNLAAPMPFAAFNPIRTGLLALDQIRLVDVFGRFYDYTAPTVHVAAGLTPPAAMNAPAGSAFLPPRLCQPSRLLFRWVSAANGTVEANAATDTSPIVAFVVPNLLDDSLAIYTGAGQPVVTLTVTGTAAQPTVAFAPLPGTLAPGAAWADIVAGQDATLTAFASALAGQGGSGSGTGSGAYLQAMLQAIERSLATSLPAAFRESASLAAIMGQPLALARATLALDLLGPAAQNQSWEALAGVAGGKGGTVDGGLGSVAVPVKLGGLQQLNDTLVGFFVGDGAAAFTTFYSPAVEQAASGVQPAAADTVGVTPGGGAVTVSLLLDPRGEVNATTGILPVKTITIPPALYASAIDGMAVTFRVGSLLTGSNAGGVSMPLPPKTLGSWSWVSAAAGGTGWTVASPADASAVQNSLAYTPQQVLDGWLSLQDFETVNKS